MNFQGIFMSEIIQDQRSNALIRFCTQICNDGLWRGKGRNQKFLHQTPSWLKDRRGSVENMEGVLRKMTFEQTNKI